MRLEWRGRETEVWEEGRSPTGKASRVTKDSLDFVLSSVRKLRERTHRKRRRGLAQ